MTRVELPKAVLDFTARGPDWAVYVDRLPMLIGELLTEWALERDGPMMHGHGSVVLPVLREGEQAVLKIAFPDVETEHEALALQRWGGRGAVRLHRADPRRRAILMERLHTTDLTELWDLEACEVVAGLYGLIHVPAPAQLVTVTSYVGRWTDALAALPRDAPIPHRLVEQALGLARDLAGDPASTGTLVHGDLHYENVLAAERAPWLAIDPQPMSGDPHYEPAPMLWNRWDELADDIRGGVRRRFHALLDAASLDEDRARAWVVVRMVVNAYWAIEDAGRLGRGLDKEEREWITCCVAVAKAVQD
ncbi:aminoglycoside phosphotransferase family protein [Nocardioides sp.]|uniref:aminoglycoside phosphotransferase family protein n=1 Tax=Nocardioides sp. TaxID=35761 RepID=UPI0031FF19A3|nr:Aminoglycoside/hydroxyurea antibiotic resistance kinase [Nocardioides sp.]